MGGSTICGGLREAEIEVPAIMELFILYSFTTSYHGTLHPLPPAIMTLAENHHPLPPTFMELAEKYHPLPPTFMALAEKYHPLVYHQLSWH